LFVLLVIVILAVLYVLSTTGRRNHKGLQALQGWSYAHRGLHDSSVPENSMEAFQRAKAAGYGVELDVHLLADGNLAVIHDAALMRTTGADGYIEDLTTQHLKVYHLEGTDQTIPEFRHVLDLLAGEVPVIVELKCVNDNYAALCKAACDMLDSYSGTYCMESFDPRCICWLRKNRPDIIRGQLAENYLLNKNPKIPWVLQFALKNHMLNFLTLPDFIAYKFRDRNSIGNWICRKLWKIQGVSWTLKDQQEYDIAVKEGWIPIFEGFQP
jgi:hypothetical protein